MSKYLLSSLVLILACFASLQSIGAYCGTSNEWRSDQEFIMNAQLSEELHNLRNYDRAVRIVASYRNRAIAFCLDPEKVLPGADAWLLFLKEMNEPTSRD